MNVDLHQVILELNRKDPRFAPYIQRLLALAKVEGTEYSVAYVKSA